VAARAQTARAEQETGTNPGGLMFPSPRGICWRSSNFARRVLASAYLAAGWRDPSGQGAWTWHSLRLLRRGVVLTLLSAGAARVIIALTVSSALS
jgi:hypothetical protein